MSATTTGQTVNPSVASKHQEPEDLLLTDLFTAYYCARANKRNTWAQVKSEQHLTDIEKDFIDDSFSCRVGKGTLYGIGRLERAMRESSADYTRESWVLKLDIAGYFMNINRQKLYDIVSSHPALALCPLTPESFSSPPLHIPSFETSSACPPFSLERRKTLHYLLSQIIFNDPTRGCRIKGSRSDWDGLPHSKSLFWSPPGCGLPIGNLTSQLFSNIYLDKLDHFVTDGLGFQYYGRYVDDFYLVDKDKKGSWMLSERSGLFFLKSCP